jgi:hypothetical protein
MFGPGGRLPGRVLDMMKSTAAKQMNIRQAAHEIMPKLRRYNLPTAELEASVQAMARVEELIKSRSGIGIRRAYSDAVNGLKKSHQAVGRQVTIQYTQDEALAKKLESILSEQQPYSFTGYEHMISAYFEALARGRDRAKADNPPNERNRTRD